MTKQERINMIVGMINDMEQIERIEGEIIDLNIKANNILPNIVNEKKYINELRLGVHWDKEPEELTNEELEAEQELVWRVLDETGYELPMEEWELCFLEKRGFYLDCEIHNREEESKKEKTFLESLGENKEEFLKEIANTF